ncbi:MAG: hypothetical protein ACT4NT_08345 [Nitrososphaerota archaeon]
MPIIFFAISVFLIFGDVREIFADMCKDLGLHYDSTSFCPTQNKKQSLSDTAQSAILRLFSIRSPVNEGNPAVFVGILSTKEGIPVRGGKITITHDGTCANKTIGHGVTDKSGRFWILTAAKVWDKKDGMIKAQAKFSDQKGLPGTASEPIIVRVYPVQNKPCQ